MKGNRQTITGLVALSIACLPVSARAVTQDSQTSAGYDVLAQRLELTPDIAGKSLTARQVITLRLTRPNVRELAFSDNTLTIDSATVRGIAVTPVHRGDALIFPLPGDDGARGQRITLKLTYHGTPARGFVVAGESLYTRYFACDWMVCAQNAFGDKAPLTLDLRVPAGMRALAVGRHVRTLSQADGASIERWKTRPYSAYLYGFAIGHFTRVEERAGAARLTTWGIGTDATSLRRRFAETGAIAEFFSGKAGVALPARRYAQLLVPGDEAQEAATYSVVGTQAVPQAPGDPVEDWAIAHELAHQWWGNLITCTSLREFWLNEGITTFMTAAWKEHRFGHAAYEAELDLARARLARARAAGFDKPLAWGGTYPNLGTRRAVQYSKGALFMDALRHTLGERAFWSGLRRYTRAHAGGTVTSRDLQVAMEVESHRSLAEIFGLWVYGSDADVAENSA
ncbi:M1 family aminopeptidase [Novosphingobium sp. 9]|uniref:M1 family aminopeptidase n=1 Tax=Novosphingobium sp. 9 TaxID=2025349 RepID=UPI0021B60D4A|nr:M1 family aminopeptidase [Novosphingobium sp. 9]